MERERIALELEEEKRAQVEREKKLEQQAKKIENLSSMVLYSNRDEIRDHPKKVWFIETYAFTMVLLITANIQISVNIGSCSLPLASCVYFSL